MPPTSTEQRLEKVEHGVNEIQRDIELIKQALLGNPLSSEEGLVGEVKGLRFKQEHMDKEIQSLRDERIRNSVYIKIIVWLLCIIGTGCIGFIVNTALNKQQPQQQVIQKIAQNDSK